MRIHLRRPLLAVALLAGCGSGDSALGTPSVDTLPGGTVVVKNSRPTRWADTSFGWHFSEVARLTGTIDSTSPLINPAWSALDAEGRFVVLEQGPLSIRIFDRSGHLVRSFGREGSGPGEMRSPIINAFGRYIVVDDPRLARLEVFDTTGELLREFPAPCCYYWTAAADDSNRVLLPMSPGGDSTVSAAFIRIDVRSGAADTIYLPRLGVQKMWTLKSGDGQIGYGVPYSPSHLSAFTARGTIIHAWSGSYRWTEMTMQGDTVRMVSKEATPVERPEAIRRARFDTIVAQASRTFGAAAAHEAMHFSDIPATAQPMGRIDADPAGRLWVQVFTGDTLHPSFDVFDAEGAWLGQVSAPWPSRENVAWWGRDEVLTQGETGEGLPMMRIWRLDDRSAE